jgi:hypothetical protein
MMVGAPVIGGLIALWGFWVLLGIGWLWGELRVRSLGIFIGLWLAGFFRAQADPVRIPVRAVCRRTRHRARVRDLSR